MSERYRTIVADPPWPVRGSQGDGRPWCSTAKPDGSYDLIEQASPGPYAELFARRARFGWDYPIGDQSLGGVAA